MRIINVKIYHASGRVTEYISLNAELYTAYDEGISIQQPPYESVFLPLYGIEKIVVTEVTK